ncbi:MAG: hypothetical protein AVDCRST_MAG35-2988, partial [uncultured Quadrisphaera sp.]
CRSSALPPPWRGGPPMATCCCRAGSVVRSPLVDRDRRSR